MIQSYDVIVVGAGHAGNEAITQAKHGAERPAQGLRACIFVHVIYGTIIPAFACSFSGGRITINAAN